MPIDRRTATTPEGKQRLDFWHGAVSLTINHRADCAGRTEVHILKETDGIGAALVVQCDRCTPIVESATIAR